MLLQNPQLAYALLQAQVVMKIVDPVIAQVGFLTLQTVISACIFFIQHVTFKCNDIVFFWKAHLVFQWCFLFSYLLVTLSPLDQVMVRSFVTLTLKSVDKILWCYHSNEKS